MKRRIRMNLRVSDFAKTGKPCVYRYVDKKDGIVKYVGIVYKQSLQKRHLCDRIQYKKRSEMDGE